MRRLQQLAAVAVALALPLAALGQAKPDEAIRARQSIMRVMALSFGPIGKMASGDAPFDKAAVQASAGRLESVWALNPGQYFVAGTDKPVAGSPIASFTAAKPEIWSQQDQFKAAAEQAGQAITKLAQVAKGGDEAAMRSAAGEVGKSCKSCHDRFRAK
jgi:cytochrome c556